MCLSVGDISVQDMPEISSQLGHPGFSISVSPPPGSWDPEQGVGHDYRSSHLHDLMFFTGMKVEIYP